MNLWLRLYCDILNSPKAQRLSGEDFKGWINLLALAKEHGGLIPPLEDVAFRLRTTEEEVRRLVEVLVKCKLLDSDGENVAPHNWHRRQFEWDSSTERVKRFRNVSETLVETAPETDTEPETEPEQSRAETETRGKPRQRPVQADDEFLDGLQKNPAYSALNVRNCYQRMVAWCEVNNKQPSRRRFINWLNREDKPMTAAPKKPPGNAYVGKHTPAPQPFVPTAEDNEFMSTYIETLIAEEDLIHMGKEYDGIVKRGGAKAEWEIRVVSYWELHKDDLVSSERVRELNASINALANR